MVDDYSVDSIVQFLDAINNINEEWRKDGSIVVYRGEPQKYDTPGKPGIFRGDYLDRDKFFEKNILLELKANKLTNSSSYLEIAIDSQHGGFPSRLLDVSYNCLIALYFACVSRPEYEKEQKDCDGHVIVYKMDKAYCPTAKNALDNYTLLVENPDCYLNDFMFSNNHKLVDHIKNNPRIIAQQGALILFQGLTYTPIPDRMIKSICINKSSKKRIAKDLDKCFGINTSFIYPEIEYAVERIKDRAFCLEGGETSLPNEIDLCIKNEIKEVEYQINQISLLKKDDQQKRIVELEKSINVLKSDLKRIINIDDKSEANIDIVHVKNYYEDLVSKYVMLFKSKMNNDFDVSYTDLLWEK